MHHVYHRKLKGISEGKMEEQEIIKNDQANLGGKNKSKQNL